MCHVTFFFQSFRDALQPDPLWGPSKAEHRTGRYAPITASFNTAYVDDDVHPQGDHYSNGSPRINGREDIELGNRESPENGFKAV